LFQQGFKIVIFTNQSGVEANKTTVAKVKQKLEDVSKALKVPVQVFAVTRMSVYRKPNVGMWEFLEKFVSNAHKEQDSDYL
jgi:bifunctional polynucleotide phosphatase/kinase